MDLRDQQYRVLPGPHPDARPSLKWNPDARLTVSGLRVCAEQVRLKIPANQVQRLLEYFEDGHPAVPVAAFVQDLMRRLHAPERPIARSRTGPLIARIYSLRSARQPQCSGDLGMLIKVR